MMRPYYVGNIPASPAKTSAEGITSSLKPGTETSYKLYPNPFAAVTDLHYRTSETAKVSVRVYDLHGRLVKDVYLL